MGNPIIPVILTGPPRAGRAWNRLVTKARIEPLALAEGYGAAAPVRDLCRRGVERGSLPAAAAFTFVTVEGPIGSSEQRICAVGVLRIDRDAK